MIRVDVTVDMVDVEVLDHEGQLVMHEAAREMWSIAHAAAREEQASHRYQNRTGNTHAGTFALDPVVVGNDDVEVELAMRTEYSSHLARRGFTNFEQTAERAGEAIERFFQDEADRLSGY